jgi:DUF177 domain-containing protein
MKDGLNSRKLKVSVTNLLRKVFSRERFRAVLDIAVGEHGLQEKGRDGDLQLDVWLESSPDGIRVKGKITGTVGLECTRCLQEYRQDLEINVDEFYRRPGLSAIEPEGRTAQHEIEVLEEDEYIIDEGMIDLNLLVNDNVILSLPIKHLCDEHCKGLCQVCGGNLNEEECGCVVEDIDPRLAPLRDLLDRKEG